MHDLSYMVKHLQTRAYLFTIDVISLSSFSLHSQLRKAMVIGVRWCIAIGHGRSRSSTFVPIELVAHILFPV